MPPEMTMRDSAASIGKWRSIRIVLAGITLAVVVMVVLFIGVRMRETYAIEMKVNSLEAAERELAVTCAAVQGDIGQRLDTLERVLFGDVLPKVDRATAERPPALRADALMLRNERDLRARVEALERWRLKKGD